MLASITASRRAAILAQVWRHYQTLAAARLKNRNTQQHPDEKNSGGHGTNQATDH